MTKIKDNKIFLTGPISPAFIAECISGLQTQNGIGAYDIFLGQVRADKIDGITVSAIEYTTYKAMAEPAIEAIIKSAFAKFELKDLLVYHSLGIVKTGETGLFVLAASAHRKPALDAVRYTVEELKAKVPVFGKEIFKDNSHQWKTNK